MSVIRIVRFTADPADTERLLTRRAELIDAVRAAFPGLTETRLARLGDDRWVDVWRWDSAASAHAATEGAPALPETAAAFALTRDVTSEQAELVDER
ncbi:antibiotic biosynthesis monooxygenase [Thermopolyspora sp. NPDC052614]|uniref:antibiotic biosynthesis monooxygenase n=1 Tax=Thermopolyspora sp. NPDC052614 TaxID=3155682 RepID=UPI0034351C25